MIVNKVYRNILHNVTLSTSSIHQASKTQNNNITLSLSCCTFYLVAVCSSWINDKICTRAGAGPVEIQFPFYDLVLLNLIKYLASLTAAIESEYISTYWYIILSVNIFSPKLSFDYWCLPQVLTRIIKLIYSPIEIDLFFTEFDEYLKPIKLQQALINNRYSLDQQNDNLYRNIKY